MLYYIKVINIEGCKFMYLDGLDEIDKRIIELLTDNARMSFVDIGKEVNLSRVAVKTRIMALENRGIIEKYTIIVNPQNINNSISAYIEIEVKPENFNEVTKILNENPIVTKLYRLTGNNKLHIHTLAADNKEMDYFMENVIYKLPGIVKINCDYIMSRVKDIIGLKL